MAKITITEALAEVKTIQKRLEKKREFVGQYLARNEQIRDPFERDGGSATVLARELQAIGDLEQRVIAIRLGIQEANQRIVLTVQGVERTLAEWLTWRRELAPNQQTFLGAIRNTLAKLRKDAQAKGMTVGIGAGVQVGQDNPQNIIVNLDERKLAEDTERIETILGELDGQLSLKNATEFIDL